MWTSTQYEKQISKKRWRRARQASAAHVTTRVPHSIRWHNCSQQHSTDVSRSARRDNYNSEQTQSKHISTTRCTINKLQSHNFRLCCWFVSLTCFKSQRDSHHLMLPASDPLEKKRATLFSLIYFFNEHCVRMACNSNPLQADTLGCHAHNRHKKQHLPFRRDQETSRTTFWAFCLGSTEFLPHFLDTLQRAIGVSTRPHTLGTPYQIPVEIGCLTQTMEVTQNVHKKWWSLPQQLLSRSHFVSTRKVYCILLSHRVHQLQPRCWRKIRSTSQQQPRCRDWPLGTWLYTKRRDTTRATMWWSPFRRLSSRASTEPMREQLQLPCARTPSEKHTPVRLNNRTPSATYCTSWLYPCGMWKGHGDSCSKQYTEMEYDVPQDVKLQPQHLQEWKTRTTETHFENNISLCLVHVLKKKRCTISAKKPLTDTQPLSS